MTVLKGGGTGKGPRVGGLSGTGIFLKRWALGKKGERGARRGERESRLVSYMVS